jgi:hypothetical protein
MKRLLFLLTILFLTSAFGFKDPASGNGKYVDLKQTLECSRDKNTYGEYYDYGYWSGGAWCGQQGKSGYWVYQYPKWYVWSQKASTQSAPVLTQDNPPPSKNSAHGKYHNLLQTLHCKRDKATYGRYYDYGYWGGGAWCGQRGVGGYWVYEYPNWYVWKNRRK